MNPFQVLTFISGYTALSKLMIKLTTGHGFPFDVQESGLEKERKHHSSAWRRRGDGGSRRPPLGRRGKSPQSSVNHLYVKGHMPAVFSQCL